MAKELSEGVRGEIMALIKEGLSHRQIAARMRVSKGAVQRSAEWFKRTNAKVWKTKVYYTTTRSVILKAKGGHTKY